ncbi:hypothetical protein LFL96_07965 [Paraburkholderia sp. D15]|uniref:hypothetical protein n=1 Tax=Paraburkholderia sp. D15 TaxID=2880218 RepID=UPI00247A5F22|nr:hypothetical protein [Paraburkholderia sp. D15]WGS51425.1 hypothetical protein LFL96_07965 [Paraburkholderia sp. D15]
MTRILGASLAMSVWVSGAIAREQSALDQYLAMKRVYEQELAAYKTSEEAGFRGETSDRILRDYQAVLFDYGKAASYWARAQMEKAPASNPPAIGLVSTPPETPTIASLDQFYESALRINAAMWRSSAAGFPNSVLIPNDPPLPPLQNERDPQFVKLVTLRAQVNKQIQAVLATAQRASQAATEAAARMGPPNQCIDEMGRNTCQQPAPPSQGARCIAVEGQGWSGCAPIN